MKNEQRKKIFNVKKSFTIDNQIVIMEGDQLEYILTENNDGKVDIYFEVIDSFWGEGLEINLTPNQVADYLAYTIH
jgi:hypothetical protein